MPVHDDGDPFLFALFQKAPRLPPQGIDVGNRVIRVFRVDGEIHSGKLAGPHLMGHRSADSRIGNRVRAFKINQSLHGYYYKEETKKNEWAMKKAR